MYYAKHKTHGFRACWRNLFYMHEDETNTRELEVLPCGEIDSPGRYGLAYPKGAGLRHLQDRRQPLPRTSQFSWQ